MRVLVTGGAGFIGSHFCRVISQSADKVLCLDNLSEGSNIENLNPCLDKSNFSFQQLDCGSVGTQYAIKHFDPHWIFHFAAQTHVDRSITGPRYFVEQNIGMTLNLLEACEAHWPKSEPRRFVQVSTDEVYGALSLTDDPFTEETPYSPQNPYSASKAACDHLVTAFGNTYGVPYNITHCSNNYGPHQSGEKFLPTIMRSLYHYQKIPLYGKGDQIRDWLHVSDHVAAQLKMFQTPPNTVWNIGGMCEMRNIDIVNLVCEIWAENNKEDPEQYKDLISFVEDRKGHDYRYAVKCDKLMGLGWKPKVSIRDGLKNTLEYFLRQRGMASLNHPLKFNYL